VAIMVAATVWGLAIIGFGLASTPLVAVAVLGVAGGADAVSGMFRQVIWNHTVPDALRGRLASIEMISYMTGPALGKRGVRTDRRRTQRPTVSDLGRGAVRPGVRDLRAAIAGVPRL